MQFDFTLTPYGAQKLDVAGKFFKFTKGTGTIRVTTDKGESIDLLPGQGVWNTSYNWITVQDRTGAANTGTVLGGSFDFHDDRISGSVEVIDGGRNRTMANMAYMSATYCAGQAGNSAMVQLWNPAGSGKRLVVSRVTRSGSTAQSVAVSLNVAQCTTLDKNAQPKLSGGAASAAQLRYQSYVGAVGTTALHSDSVQAGVALTLQYVEPLVVLPGYGLTMIGQALGAELLGAFEFFEDPIV